MRKGNHQKCFPRNKSFCRPEKNCSHPEQFSVLSCGGGKITQKTTSCGPPLPGPKNEENILQSHRIHARRSQLRPLVPLVRRAKEQGRKSTFVAHVVLSIKVSKKYDGPTGQILLSTVAGRGVDTMQTHNNQPNKQLNTCLGRVG